MLPPLRIRYAGNDGVLGLHALQLGGAEMTPTPQTEWRAGLDDELGPHFRAEDGRTVYMLYLDGVEWSLRVEHPDMPSMATVRRLWQVLELVPDLRDEVVGIMKAAMHREASKVRDRLVAALAALDAGDYAHANVLVDDLHAWHAGHAQEDLQEAGAL